MLFSSHDDLKRQVTQAGKKTKLVILELKAAQLCGDAEGRRNLNGYHSLRGWERDGVGGDG